MQAPVAGIPIEILSEIFILCMKDISWHNLDNIPAPNDAPFLFLRVCRHWREVAQSTPHLWTSIYFPDVPSNEAGRESLLTQVPIWLSLSRSLPLTFMVNIMPNNPAYFQQYMAFLVQEIYRWKSAKFYVGFNSIYNFLPIESRSMPLLEEFTFGADEMEFNDDVPMFMTFLASAPLLRCVQLHSPRLSGWSLPWANLTELRMMNIGQELTPSILRQFYDSISQCTCVEFLGLGFRSGLLGPIIPSTSPIKLSKVTFFSLSCTKHDIAVFLLNTLIMPVLEEVELIFSDSRETMESEVDLVNSICHFFSRSDSGYELTLESTRIRDLGVIRILQHLPDLQRLHLIGIYVTAQFFNALTLRFRLEDGLLIAGQNLILSHLSCTPSLRYEDFTANRPRLPYALRRQIAPENYPFYWHVDPEDGRDTPNMITFPPSELLDEDDVSTQTLQGWLAQVGHPTFGISMTNMIHSRRFFPPNAHVRPATVSDSNDHRDDDDDDDGDDDGDGDNVDDDAGDNDDNDNDNNENDNGDNDNNDNDNNDSDNNDSDNSDMNEPERRMIEPLTLFRFIHYDLHLLEVLAPPCYHHLLRLWQQGFDLNVWTSRQRSEYWRQRYAAARAGRVES